MNGTCFLDNCNCPLIAPPTKNQTGTCTAGHHSYWCYECNYAGLNENPGEGCSICNSECIYGDMFEADNK